MNAEDDVFSENFERRARWSLDVGQEDCSEVFAKVIQLEDLRKKAMKKIPETEAIQSAHHALKQLRRMQPAATSGNLEDEKDAATIDEAMQDMMALEVLYELKGPEAKKGPEFLTKLLSEAAKIIKIGTDGNTGQPKITYSVSVCKATTCFIQNAQLTMWAFLVTQYLYPSGHKCLVSADFKPTLEEFIENLGKTSATLTSDNEFILNPTGTYGYNIHEANENQFFASSVSGSTSGSLASSSTANPFDRYAEVDYLSRAVPSTALDRAQYANIWNTVCAPEFIQILLKPIERVGRPFPENENTLGWKKLLEQRTADQAPFNFVCNEIVGVSDNWCVNVLMTTSKIFLPRHVPDLGAGNFTRFVSLCRYDGGPNQCFGLLVFDWGAGTLTYVDDPASKVRNRHLTALQDWFMAGHRAIMRQGKQNVPKIERIYFSSMTSSWERLCRTLGSNGADLLTCIALATNEEDKCAAGAVRDMSAGDLAYAAVATLASNVKRGVKSKLRSGFDWLVGT